MRWGIRAVVGESFAEIFYGNCLALGIPCFTASHASVLSLQEALIADSGQELSLSLVPASLETSHGRVWQLELQAGPQQMLGSGHWDATSQLLAHDSELNCTAASLPYLNGF
jgi:3-isopropylmalate/(R)-2-methylmalate dehydratase small subunit